MNPLVQAIKLRASVGADFWAEFQAHLATGVVISTPRIFLMGRPCPKGADMSDIRQRWSSSKCDAWFVWCAVGELGDLLAAIPFPLPWIGWHRQGRGWERNHWVRATKLAGAKNVLTA